MHNSKSLQLLLLISPLFLNPLNLLLGLPLKIRRCPTVVTLAWNIILTRVRPGASQEILLYLIPWPPLLPPCLYLPPPVDLRVDTPLMLGALLPPTEGSKMLMFLLTKDLLVLIILLLFIPLHALHSKIFLLTLMARTPMMNILIILNTKMSFMMH